MTEERIAREIYARLTGVIDPELGKSITDLGMVTGVEVDQMEAGHFTVHLHIELTVPHCPLSDVIREKIEQAVASYPDVSLTLDLDVSSMSEEKLNNLVTQLKQARRENPFHKKGIKTRIFAVASGKGGVGKSSVTANLAAAFA
ncbi:MAG: iron-sulfur cluster assembly protein, partial [Alloscardovia omnicolens]|nr:iron-sulfur cluster assembly protein [Alloscardovia omnicolens]